MSNVRTERRGSGRKSRVHGEPNLVRGRLVSAIVLAAGRSSRMGQPKQLLKLGRKTLLGHVLTSLRQSKVDEIVLVLGSNADQILKESSLSGVKVVLNPNYASGQSTSLRAGLEAVNPKTSAVVICLADQPLVSPTTINELIERYQHSEARVVLPTHGGRRGNPVLFDRRLFGEMKQVTGDVGAKHVVKLNENKLLEVEVEDEGILTDIDTLRDYQRVKSLYRDRKTGD